MNKFNWSNIEEIEISCEVYHEAREHFAYLVQLQKSCKELELPISEKQVEYALEEIRKVYNILKIEIE